MTFNGEFSKGAIERVVVVDLEPYHQASIVQTKRVWINEHHPHIATLWIYALERESRVNTANHLCNLNRV